MKNCTISHLFIVITCGDRLTALISIGVFCYREHCTIVVICVSWEILAQGEFF